MVGKSAGVPKTGRLTRAERHAETRRRLITATIESLRDIGFFDVTTSLVAKRAAVSRGALQHHFRTRNDLLLSVMESVGEELSSAFDGGCSEGASIEERVNRICRTYWRVYRSDAYIAQLQIWIGARNDQQLQKKINALVQKMAQAQDRMWREFFPDPNIASRELTAMKNITLSCIRGAALRPASGPEANSFPSEVSVLARMVADALSKAAARAPAATSAPRTARRRSVALC